MFAFLYEFTYNNFRTSIGSTNTSELPKDANKKIYEVKLKMEMKPGPIAEYDSFIYCQNATGYSFIFLLR
jgi:hypothetical protein